MTATLIVTGLSFGLLGVQVATMDPPTPAPVQVAPEPEPEPLAQFGEVDHSIRKGETLGVILQRYGVNDVGGVLAAAKPHYDLSRIRAGRTLTFLFERDVPQPIGLSYPLDADRTLVVNLQGDSAQADVQAIEYQEQLGVRELVLTSSLWSAAIEAGLNPSDIVAIARVFQWQLDFNTELRAGARFKVVANELYLDNEYVKAGNLHAVRLENGGKTYTAVRYEDSQGNVGWYQPDGTASKRPFLRSPLEFSRVTSKFTRKRYHPVLKRNRAHLGTDMGASTGTPVRAVGDGVVKFAATNGGHGKHVKLNHEGPYETSYSHLSRIKVKKGQRIKQGDIIGLVGSTGMSTGPHLHYEFKVNGKHVDPMKVKLPNARALPREELSAFAAVRDHWLPILEGAPLPTPDLVEGDALVDGQPF